MKKWIQMNKMNVIAPSIYTHMDSTGKGKRKHPQDQWKGCQPRVWGKSHAECWVVYLCVWRSAVRADFESNHKNLHGIISANILVTIIGLAFVSCWMWGFNKRPIFFNYFEFWWRRNSNWSMIEAGSDLEMEDTAFWCSRPKDKTGK